MANAALLLGQATTRIVYDLDRYRTAQQPVFAATLARETHVSDPLPAGGLKVQLIFGYSDGFGREIQKKVQAEPGPLDPKVGPRRSPIPRWVGSGWTIFNNKGKPVRQYEPFFSATHAVRVRAMRSASARSLFYDPVERVVATLHPNHTCEKVVFDPWRQDDLGRERHGARFDPKTDPDVGEFFSRLAGRGLPADLVRSSAIDGALGAGRAGRGRQRPPRMPTRRPSPISTRSAGPS